MGLPSIHGRSQPIPLAPLPTEGEPPGSILYVPKDVAHLVHIGARLERLDPSTRTTIDEAVLPVVRDADFEHRTQYFPGLKNHPTERVHVRVYSLDVAHREPLVRVRVQEAHVGSSWTFVYDAVHRLAVNQKLFTWDGEVFDRRPLALELLLDPVLRGLPVGGDIAVSVVPAREGLRIWSMVSETNNTTQRVRIALPQ